MRRHPTVFVPFSEGLEGTWTWAFRVIETEAEALLEAATTGARQSPVETHMLVDPSRTW